MIAIADNHGSEALAERIEGFAEDLKAQNLVRLDLRKKSSVADYFIICTGTSDVHIRAIAESVLDKMREQHDERPRRRTGLTIGTGWALLDYGDVVFHAMSEEKRQFYDLESLWEAAELDTSLT